MFSNEKTKILNSRKTKKKFRVHFHVFFDFDWIRFFIVRWLRNIFIKVLHDRFVKRLFEQRRSIQQFQLFNIFIIIFVLTTSRPDLHQRHNNLIIQHEMMFTYSQNAMIDDKIELNQNHWIFQFKNIWTLCNNEQKIFEFENIHRKITTS